MWASFKIFVNRRAWDRRKRKENIKKKHHFIFNSDCLLIKKIYSWPGIKGPVKVVDKVMMVVGKPVFGTVG